MYASKWNRLLRIMPRRLNPESSFVLKTCQLSSVQSLSRVQLFATPWIAARQASLSITNSRSSLRLTSIESVMPSSHLILSRPLLLLPQSLPASGSFPMSQLFTWGGQSTGVSALASFLPKKSQADLQMSASVEFRVRTSFYPQLVESCLVNISHKTLFQINYFEKWCCFVSSCFLHFFSFLLPKINALFSLTFHV